MPRTITVLALAAVVLGGCAAEEQPEPTASPTPSPSSTPPEDDSDEPDPSPSPSDDDGDDGGDDGDELAFTDCEAADFTVAHPAAWQTNEASELVDACRVFHPGEIDLPDEPQGIGLHWAVRLNIDEVPYEDVVGADASGEVLQQRDTTVDGRPARVIEVRSEGEALVPEGEVRYGYAVDLDGRTLLASTYTIGDTDYERDKRVLDRMLDSIRFAAGG